MTSKATPGRASNDSAAGRPRHASPNSARNGPLPWTTTWAGPSSSAAGEATNAGDAPAETSERARSRRARASARARSRSVGTRSRSAVDSRGTSGTELIAADGLLEVVLELPAPGRMAELPERLRLDLADALAGNVELLAHLLEGSGTPVLEAEPEL